MLNSVGVGWETHVAGTPGESLFDVQIVAEPTRLAEDAIDEIGRDIGCQDSASFRHIAE